MSNRTVTLLIFILIASNFAQAQDNPAKKTPESTEIWEPQPRIVTPGASNSDAPSDAIILFNGSSVDEWTGHDNGPVKWTLKDGSMTVIKGTGNIRTKKDFGDFQLHIEWRTPEVTNPDLVSQSRGNSGVYLQDRYEVQVLDNYENKTYANGQAGSIYKQHIPLVNVSRKPGEWQSYDIVFYAPRFNNEGRVSVPGRITVFHNGVLIQYNVEVWGPTEYIGIHISKPHGKAPIRLQDHGDSVSYRNIWVREL